MLDRSSLWKQLYIHAYMHMFCSKSKYLRSAADISMICNICTILLTNNPVSYSKRMRWWWLCARMELSVIIRSHSENSTIVFKCLDNFGIRQYIWEKQKRQREIRILFQGNFICNYLEIETLIIFFFLENMRSFN